MSFISYNVASININNITSPTKLNALRNFIGSQNLDIVCLQEVENEQLSLPGFVVVANVDHARRGTAIALKSHIQHSHFEKSLDGRLIALRVQDVLIVNIYAPSGTAQRAAREEFFNTTLAYYLRNRTEHVILMGDFNCVLRPCDSSSPNTSPSLKMTVQQLQLLDIWERLYPRDEGFTFVSRNARSRLDRIYVSTGLREHLRAANTHVCSFSDHKAITLSLFLPLLGHEHGRGYWSLRPHLLTDENVADFQYRWQFWTRERQNYRSWIDWWMSYAKPKTKKFFKCKSRAAFDDFHNEHQRLYAELQRAYDSYYQNPVMLSTINRLKGEMLTLQRNFSHMFMRINETFVAGEPISIFQLGDRRRRRTVITRLQTEQQAVIYEPHAIEAHMVDYFSRLYAEEEREDVENYFNCENAIPHNDALNDACTDEITTSEIFAAIQASASRKSPGSDGLPKEFYNRVFDVIHRELNLVMNDALSGNFPEDFVDGIIVLVKKKGNDNTARSYRPISLLNTDYKLFSRILKTRLEGVMRAHHILSDAQKCSNSERNIFQATLALKDRIASLRHHRRAGKLISFDLDHAFDRVRHSFLFGTMLSLGFNQRFVSLLSQIACRSTSRLLVNGHLSSPIDIQRSVRQGDPLSMHLFVLYLHPLISRLEQACNTDLLVAYADDISVIVSSTAQIDTISELFTRFEASAGAKLNVQKTTAIDVGYCEENHIHVHWLQTTNTVKILGIIFANSIRLMTTLNWDTVTGKFARLMWLQSSRALTLLQKVTVLNTFGTSRIWYLSSILPPLSLHIAKITSRMGTFLWSGMIARVPMMQLARKREHGGVQLQLPALKCKSLAIHRHLREINSLPFYRSFLFHNNPRQINPMDHPDLRIILANLPQIPLPVQQNITAEQIHQHFIQQTEAPRVEQYTPTNDWQRTWRNVMSSQLSSLHRSTLFRAVNGKIEHRRILFVMRRVENEHCTFCDNATVETLQHKFSSCARVCPAWAILQQKIADIMNGWRRLSYDELIRPSLERIDSRRRIAILKLFAEYICYISNCSDRIDTQSLEHHLNLNS